VSDWSPTNGLEAGGLRRATLTGPAVRWLVAALSVSLADVLSLALRDGFKRDPSSPSPLSLFFCAVIFSSWFGGTGPGVFAALAAIGLIQYYFIPPLHHFLPPPAEVPRLVMLLATSLFISWLTGRQKQAENALRVARNELEKQVETRTLELREKTRQLETAIIILREDLTGRQLLAAKLQGLNRLYAFSNSVNEVIIRFHDPQELYERACQIAVDQCGFILAVVRLAAPEGHRLNVAAHAGQDYGYLTRLDVSTLPQPHGFSPIGRAYRENRVAWSNDIANDPGFQPWRDLALQHGYRSCAAVPLNLAGRPFGTFAVYGDQPEFFGPEELRLLETMGENLSFAIDAHQNEHERLSAETALRVSNQQLHDLAARLQAVQEEERTRIAREIHDELGQLLTGLKMDLRAMEQELERLADPRLNPLLDHAVSAAEITDALARSVHHIASELRPAILDRLGLVTALTHETEQFQQRTGITCRLTPPETDPLLPDEAATALFRICQEALTNVARHAGATAVEIEFRHPPGEIVLEIRDNGQGIQAADLADHRSLGVLGMQERARQLGGNVTFSPHANGGTVVTVRIPQPSTPAHHA